MRTRPTNIPAQTIKQAKAEYKKHGPRTSSQQARQITRGAQLYERAEKIRETERRRKAAKQRKLEREQRERESKRRMGIPSQTLPKVAASQQLLNGFFKETNDTSEGSNESKASEITREIITEEDDWGGVDDEVLLDTVDHIESSWTSEERSSTPEPSALCYGDEKPRTDDPFRETKTFLQKSDTSIAKDEKLAARQDIRFTKAGPADETCLLSTQDVSFSRDDLVELGLFSKKTITCGLEQKSRSNRNTNSISMPPPSRLQKSAQMLDISSSMQARELSKAMPPPPKPKFPSHAQSNGMSIDKSPFLLASDFAPNDFDLSSQDYREINV